MATPIRIKRSAVPGKRPTSQQLLSAELAYNTYDGELTAKRERPGIGTDIVRIGAGATVTNVLYVTGDGNDSNTGRKLGDAKATIKSALAESTTGTVIRVSAGSYLEDNPLVIPEQVSIVGDSLREVSISPLNPDSDLFYVSNGNYVAEISYTGTLNPGKAIFAFNPEQVGYFDQSPYIQNCTNFIPNSMGLKIDGSKAIGPTKSMVVDSYTQYNQGGIGVSITNEGYAQLVSIFTICNDISIFCGSGAACDLTNSNSSFGNYALVSDGIGPLKYTGILTESSSANSDTFILDLNVPTLNVVAAKYDNVSGVVTITTQEPHKFSVGMGISIAGLGFTCPSGPGILTYPSGNKGYVFEAFAVAPGRYLDAYDSIQANRREIQDKSLAAIAVDYNEYINTNFYFPGEDETNSRSRYYDATRLITLNKQEIVDKSLASIAVGFSSGFKFPDDPDPYEQNRYYDASRLITLNKQEIVDKSLASIAVGFSSGFKFPDDPDPYEQNRYYDASRLITLNKQEIVDKSLAAIAIAHSDFYFPGDTQTTIRSRYYDSYRLIQNNRDVIVNTAWSATSSVYPDFNYTETKCKRDIGFFIDAISTDVFTGGNSYSRDFVLQYFSGTSLVSIASSEREPSVFAFQTSRDLMKQAITNTLVGAAYSDLTITTDPSSCADVQSNIDNLVGIVTVSIGAGNTDLPFPSIANRGYFDLSVGIGTTVSPGGVKCARDLSFLVEAVATDVFTGGNKYSRDFTLQYFDNSGVPISNGLDGETQESITAFNALGEYSKKAITNQLNYKEIGISSGFSTYPDIGNFELNLPSGNPNACADVQSNIDNLVGIVTTVIGSGSTTFLSTFNENLGISTTNKCARDLGYLVEAVATDVFTGGNKYSRDFTLQYFDNSGVPISNGLDGETAESVYAFNTLREYAKKAITNQLNYKEIGISSGFSTYPDIGNFELNLPSGNTNACADVQQAVNNLVGIVTTVIGSGSTTFLSTFNENLGISTTNKCARDLGYLVDAISTDVFTGGNKYSRDFTKQYFNNSGVPISNGLLGETAESVYAFNTLGQYAKKAITNQLNYKEIGISSGFSTYPNIGNFELNLPSGNPNACADVQSNIDNLVGIVTTVIGIGSEGNYSYLNTFNENLGTFSDGVSKCMRDIGFIIDAVSTDVRDFTSFNSIEATKAYFNLNGTLLSNGLEGEIEQTIVAFNKSRDLMKLAITNNLNNKNPSLIPDPLTGSNIDPDSCSDVKSFIDNLVGIITTRLDAGNINGIYELPTVSMASTEFSAYVGTSTLPHTYNSGGTVKINVPRPFDGQIVYFDRLYYSINGIDITDGGSGYTGTAEVFIDPPEIEWGIPATAVAEVSNGKVTSIEMVSNGRGYTTTPTVRFSSPNSGINTATGTAIILPTYYPILSSTPVSAGICTITVTENVPYSLEAGTKTLFYKQSRVLASGQSLEYIGSGTDIDRALPARGGVPIQENETVSLNGGLVVFTSTDQSGNFRIGEGVQINQLTGSISGRFYSKSLFSTMTPFILALS